jgi:hypothetical protein
MNSFKVADATRDQSFECEPFADSTVSNLSS